MALLEIRDLRLEFRSAPGRRGVCVVDGVSLSIEAGETLGLVGESGCGKSVTALSIARLLPTPPARVVGGAIHLQDRNVFELPPSDLRRLRGGVVSYVFQEPGASLNPVLRVGTQIMEALRLHRPGQANHGEVVRLLQLVGIPAPEARQRDFPHQMSGGMQQRVMIAMALASEPRLLVADEPTTALDVTIQAQIMDLLRELQRQLGMAILLISHNLGLVGSFAHRIAVMYAGEIVEQGQATEILRHPRHPYTRGLLDSSPELGKHMLRFAAIPGAVPAPGRWPAGCRFSPRCGISRPDCGTSHPPLAAVAGADRRVRCPYWDTQPAADGADHGPA